MPLSLYTHKHIHFPLSLHEAQWQVFCQAQWPLLPRAQMARCRVCSSRYVVRHKARHDNIPFGYCTNVSCIKSFENKFARHGEKMRRRAARKRSQRDPVAPGFSIFPLRSHSHGIHHPVRDTDSLSSAWYRKWHANLIAAAFSVKKEETEDEKAKKEEEASQEEQKSSSSSDATEIMKATKKEKEEEEEER